MRLRTRVLKVKGGCKGVSDKSRCMSAADAMDYEEEASTLMPEARF